MPMSKKGIKLSFCASRVTRIDGLREWRYSWAWPHLGSPWRGAVFQLIGLTIIQRDIFFILTFQLKHGTRSIFSRRTWSALQISCSRISASVLKNFFLLYFMGSSLSSIVFNIFISIFNRVLENAPTIRGMTKIHRRCTCSFQGSPEDALEFLEYLMPSICFILEMEKANFIPFWM